MRSVISTKEERKMMARRLGLRYSCTASISMVSVLREPAEPPKSRMSACESSAACCAAVAGIQLQSGSWVMGGDGVAERVSAALKGLRESRRDGRVRGHRIFCVVPYGTGLVFVTSTQDVSPGKSETIPISPTGTA